MRGKRHIAQNACISLCGARRLQDKYITIFAFTLATRRSVSRQTYQTARSFRRTRLRRTVEDACPYSLRVALIVGRILWVAFCGSHFAGRILWVVFCGSHFAGRILRVAFCGSHFAGRIAGFILLRVALRVSVWFAFCDRIYGLPFGL